MNPATLTLLQQLFGAHRSVSWRRLALLIVATWLFLEHAIGERTWLIIAVTFIAAEGLHRVAQAVGLGIAGRPAASPPPPTTAPTALSAPVMRRRRPRTTATEVRKIEPDLDLDDPVTEEEVYEMPEAPRPGPTG